MASAVCAPPVDFEDEDVGGGPVRRIFHGVRAVLSDLGLQLGDLGLQLGDRNRWPYRTASLWSCCFGCGVEVLLPDLTRYVGIDTNIILIFYPRNK